MRNFPSAHENAPYFKILPLMQPLEDDTIQIDKIRQLTAMGLNGAPAEDRALAWLALIGLHPLHAREWHAIRTELNTVYRSYIQEFKLENYHTKSIPMHCLKDAFDVDDQNLMDIIHKDIVRTAKHIFMLPPAPLEGEKDDGTLLYLYTIHLRRLERILYIMGKVYKPFGYMQGFNELLMPLYTVFYSSKSIFHDDIEVEALSFNCLLRLLGQTNLIELFMTMNKSENLIARLSLFNNVLDSKLPEVSRHLKKQEIFPLLYAFKWFCLLFCQNHEMPVIHEIWDSLLSHFDHLIDFAFYIGAAEMKIVEKAILSAEFSTTLQVLQNIHVNDIYSVLAIANKWWDDDNKPHFMSSMSGMFHSLKNKAAQQISNLTGK